MKDWQAAAICVAAYQWAEHMTTKTDELPNEGRVILSLLRESISKDDYDAAAETIARVTEGVMFEDVPEARELREYLDLRTVN